MVLRVLFPYLVMRELTSLSMRAVCLLLFRALQKPSVWDSRT